MDNIMYNGMEREINIIERDTEAHKLFKQEPWLYRMIRRIELGELFVNVFEHDVYLVEK